MDHKIEKIARTGFIAKGAVYGIAGVLTFLAAFNMGGDNTGKLQVLKFLDKQPFGNALLILMGLGLICYSVWRFIESFSDPEGIGRDDKGKAKRVAYFFSGLIYLGLGIIAILRVFGSSSSGPSGNTASQSSFLASETGLILLGIAGVAIIISGIFQFKKVRKKTYLRHFGREALGDEEKRETIKKSATFGLCSRGVLFLIIGYFALRAALSSNPSQIKTTEDAFAFIRENPYGSWLMGIVAAGLIGYAIFMLMTARYRSFHGRV